MEDKKTLAKATEHALTLLCKRNPFDNDKVGQASYVMLLLDYIENQGETALQALAGFYCWAIDNKGAEATPVILETFRHDLFSQEEKFMLPRSTDYLEFWIKELETRQHFQEA